MQSWSHLNMIYFWCLHLKKSIYLAMFSFPLDTFYVLFYYFFRVLSLAKCYGRISHYNTTISFISIFCLIISLQEWTSKPSSPVMMDDEIDGFKQDGVLGVGMLHFLWLWRLLWQNEQVFIYATVIQIFF